MENNYSGNTWMSLIIIFEVNNFINTYFTYTLSYLICEKFFIYNCEKHREMCLASSQKNANCIAHIMIKYTRVIN